MTTAAGRPRSLFTWLSAEAPAAAAAWIAVYATPLIAAPAVIQTLVLNIIGVHATDANATHESAWARSHHGWSGYAALLGALVVTALSEELFRNLPLGLVAWRWRTPLVIGPATVVVCAALAMGHVIPTGASLASGVVYMWSRGVGGLVLAGVFFKCGGLNRHPVKGYCFAALSHFIYDAVVFTLVLATG